MTEHTFYLWRVAEVRDLQGHLRPWLAHGSSEIRQLEKQSTFVRWLTPYFNDKHNPASLKPNGFFIEWPIIGGRKLAWSESNQPAIDAGLAWSPAYQEALGVGPQRDIEAHDNEQIESAAMRKIFDELPPFDDSDVKVVYSILESPDQPPEFEHWEGFAARRIIKALSYLHPVAEAHLQEYVETHQRTWWVTLLKGQEFYEVRSYPYKYKNRAEYEVAALNHFLTGSPKPNILHYPDPEEPNGSDPHLQT